MQPSRKDARAAIMELVKAAGGEEAVAAACGVKIWSVMGWRNQGVPERHHPVFVARIGGAHAAELLRRASSVLKDVRNQDARARRRARRQQRQGAAHVQQRRPV